MAILRHGTTTPDQVEVVQLGVNVPRVTVLKRTSAGELWFCVDTDGGPADDGIPVAEGNDTYLVPEGVGSYEDATSRGSGDSVVRLLSSVAVTYSVLGVDT